MKLDASRLRAEADAHRARMESPLWERSDGEQDQAWVAPVTGSGAANQRAPRPQSSAAGAAQDVSAEEILPRLDALDRSLEHLKAAVNRQPTSSEELVGRLQAAAGNPHTYDAPDSTRASVCARILPTTYAQVQLAQRRLGLRTKAGTWEYLLRLGLAVAEQLKNQRG